MGALRESKYGEAMPRRNQGPRLRWLEKRKCFYITWTENGRSRERSTGTRDRERAEAIFSTWLQARGRRSGPCNPSEIFVTELLTEYALAKADEVIAPRVIGCAIDALTPFWQGRALSEVTKQTCKLYGKRRERSPNTIRRELSVLRASINLAYEEGRITRPVHVELPEPPEPRKRCLTRNEAARLIRATRTATAPVLAAFYPAGALHGETQRGASVASLASGRPTCWSH
jgi:hypothetical protein